jgi:hypothetical protein
MELRSFGIDAAPNRRYHTGMTPTPIKHSYWVLPGKFLAGEYPRELRVQASKEKIDALIQAGVTAFIDLTEDRDGLEPYAPLFEAHPSKGVTHKRFPIRDLSVPASSQQTIAILDAIDENIRQGKLVYVHCWGGIGRTGTIVGCWLARHEQPGQAALDRLHELWEQCPKSAYRRSPETWEQEQYILGWNESPG